MAGQPGLGIGVGDWTPVLVEANIGTTPNGRPSHNPAAPTAQTGCFQSTSDPVLGIPRGRISTLPIMATVHQPAPNATVTTTGDLSNLHYTCIIAFNTEVHHLFTGDTTIPDGKKEAALAIDISGSMDTTESREQLQIVVAELIKGTNAEGNMNPIPPPSDLTALVEGVAELNRLSPMAQFKAVITDGGDNQFVGQLATGVDEATGEYINVTIDNTATPHDNDVCDHIEHVMGTEAFIVGINAPTAMLNRLSNRRATVVNIPHGTRTASAIIGAIRHGRRVRQSGGTTNRQILTTTDEAQAIASAIPEAELAQATTAANAVVITASSAAAAPPPPVTKEEALEIIARTNAILKNPVSDGEEMKQFTALICFFGEAASDGDGIPGAALFGRHCGMLQELPKSDLKKSMNQALPKFGERLFTKSGTTGPEGAQLTIAGRTLKFGKNCDIFKCNIPTDVLKEISDDRAVAVDVAAVFKSSKNSPLKRAREGPDDDAVQPARAAA